MLKLLVLVTGGAGYLGKPRGPRPERPRLAVFVIDNLCSGTRGVVPRDVSFYAGNVADRALVEGIFAPVLVGSNRRLIETLGWNPRFADVEVSVTHA